MKIFMIHPHDIERDPWTIRITALAEKIVEKGHHVTICYFCDPDAIAGGRVKFQEFTHYNIELVKLERTRKSFFKNIKKTIKKSRGFDIIHLQKCFAHAVLPALYASLINKIPVHYDWDDNETAIAYDCIPSRLIVSEKSIFESLLLFFSTTISTASENLKQKALNAGFPSERIVDAPVGADLELFSPAENIEKLKKSLKLSDEVVIYQGQLEGGNYAKIFVSAASHVLSKRENVTFVIVGGGFRLKEIKESAKLAGVENKITFTGFIKQEKVAEYIKASDVCVATFEKNEITVAKSPLKIAEYLASGKPIVASDVGDVSKMVGDAGILVPPGDIQKTAEAMLTLLNDKEKRLKYSVTARQRAETIYNWESTSNNIISAYKIALGS